MKKLAWLPLVGLIWFFIDNDKDPLYWIGYIIPYGFYQGLIINLCWLIPVIYL